MMLELMYGTMPSENIPSFEMLPPVSVSTYPITPPPPARDSANAARSTPLIGTYVPTRDTTSNARTVAIFPGKFPEKKSPIFPLSPVFARAPVARVVGVRANANASPARAPPFPKPNGSNVSNGSDGISLASACDVAARIDAFETFDATDGRGVAATAIERAPRDERAIARDDDKDDATVRFKANDDFTIAIDRRGRNRAHARCGGL